MTKKTYVQPAVTKHELLRESPPRGPAIVVLPIRDGAATKVAKEMLGLASTKVLASSSLLTHACAAYEPEGPWRKTE